MFQILGATITTTTTTTKAHSAFLLNVDPETCSCSERLVTLSVVYKLKRSHELGSTSPFKILKTIHETFKWTESRSSEAKTESCACV